MINVERFKEEVKQGDIKFLVDKFIGKDNLPYCAKCKQPLFAILDNTYAVKAICKCTLEELANEEEQKEIEAKALKLKMRQDNSLMGNRYKNCNFANATINGCNSAIYGKCRNFVDKASISLNNNIGLYIYGDNGVGKTYLTACMCNALIERGYNCLYVSLGTILNSMKEDWGAESSVLEDLEKADFLFMDDLGKEFLGREFSPSAAKWNEQKLYQVINTRYNSKKPIIFSSNYTIKELLTVLHLDKAIVERIGEMATAIYNLQCDNFRKTARQDSQKYISKLGL